MHAQLKFFLVTKRELYFEGKQTSKRPEPDKGETETCRLALTHKTAAATVAVPRPQQHR